MEADGISNHYWMQGMEDCKCPTNQNVQHKYYIAANNPLPPGAAFTNMD